jgi:integrase
VKGTTIRYARKKGKPTFGYSFFAGRDKNKKRIQKVKRGFETRDEAEKALRKAIEEHGKAPTTIVNVPTFADFFERWHRECVARECSPKTVERTHELGQYAIRLFGDIALDKLTSQQLATHANRLLDCGGRPTTECPNGRPLAPKTVRHILFVIQACLKQAVDWDMLARNPMARVKKPKLPRRKPKIVDRTGFDALLKQTAGTTVYPVIVLAMATGMRRGELLALEWSDLDWENATLDVSKSLEETKQGLRVKSTKSGRTRCFAVPAAVLEVLHEHRLDQDEQRRLYEADYENLNLIFARPEGGYYSPDKLGTRVRAAMNRAGLKNVSLHSLRHSHASELLSKGAPITAVAERLGHANPNITLGIYSHAMPTDNVATAKLWNDTMADVIQDSRKEAARKRMLSNVIKESGEKRLTLLKKVG